jgi:hypothetical protein
MIDEHSTNKLAVSGAALPIVKYAIDSGDATGEVYGWARKYGGAAVVIKGARMTIHHSRRWKKPGEHVAIRQRAQIRARWIVDVPATLTRTDPSSRSEQSLNTQIVLRAAWNVHVPLR